MVFKTIDRDRFLQEFPHIIEPMYDGRTYRLLVTVTGRPAMCFKCESCECPEVNFCKTCRKWGHVTCPRRNTYASRLQKKPAEEGPKVLEVKALMSVGEANERDSSLSEVDQLSLTLAQRDRSEQLPQNSSSDNDGGGWSPSHGRGRRRRKPRSSPEDSDDPGVGGAKAYGSRSEPPRKDGKAGGMAGGLRSKTYQFHRSQKPAVRPISEIFTRKSGSASQAQDRARIILERSFIFKVVSKGAQILREDFADALKVHIKLEEVLYLGTLGRPDTWHCTVQNIDTKTALLALGELVVCGRKVYVQESDHFKNICVLCPVRIHWNSIH